MVSYGFGTVISALIMGKIVDGLGAKKSVWFLVFFMCIVTCVMFYSVYSERFNWVTFLMTFLVGSQDSFFNIHVMKILGSEFTSKSEPFAIC